MNPPPAPKHKSFKITKGAYGVWWMYKWQPTIALGIMALFGFKLGFLARAYGIPEIFAVILGVLVALLIGWAYNQLAGKKGWQKLSVHDIWPSAGL